jgi:hypothetical protein
MLSVFKRKIIGRLSERTAFFRAGRRCEGRFAWKAVVDLSPESTIEVGTGSRICNDTVLATLPDEGDSLRSGSSVEPMLASTTTCARTGRRS